MYRTARQGHLPSKCAFYNFGRQEEIPLRDACFELRKNMIVSLFSLTFLIHIKPEIKLGVSVHVTPTMTHFPKHQLTLNVRIYFEKVC